MVFWVIVTVVPVEPITVRVNEEGAVGRVPVITAGLLQSPLIVAAAVLGTLPNIPGTKPTKSKTTRSADIITEDFFKITHLACSTVSLIVLPSFKFRWVNLKFSMP